MIILGIETSCDETAVALIEVKATEAPNSKLQIPSKFQVRILSNIVSSQVKIHAKYGGIVPEVAARKHVEMMVPVLEQALASLSSPGRRSSATSPSVKETIDLIAVTNGPGLITSLMVGVETAKALAFAWDKPIVAVNHLAGHLWSYQLPKPNSQYPIPNAHSMPNVQFPMLGLIVSGGHTELVLVKDYEKYQVIGQTIDDAAGEAFDKVAKILGLDYPGGPIISRLAEQGNPTTFDFPRPMMKSDDFNFSFAGLKTAVLYQVRDLKEESRIENLESKVVADFCASFQQAAVDVLVAKTVRAAKKYRVKTIVIGGGVSANRQLREQMQKAVQKEIPDSSFQLPDSKYCLDNAAMIALAGYYRFKQKGADDFRKLTVDPNLKLS